MRLIDPVVVGLPRRAVSGVENAGQTWRTRRGLLLTIRDEQGRVGHGEASPLPGYSSDTLGQARRALKIWCESAPPRVDLEAPVEAVAAIVARVDRGVPSARFAVETALLDLVGQRLDRPVWSLLCGEAMVPESVPLSGLITSVEAHDAAKQARGAYDRGLRTLKLKVGRSGRLDDELAVLAAVRAAVGIETALRLDANGTLPLEDLDATLARLAAFGPVLIEEPVGCGALSRLPGSPMPIAVDETLRAPEGWSTVEHLATKKLLAAIVLKPMVLGGALACLDLGRRAADLGVAAYVTHLFDGPVARAAGAHLALALPGQVLACGLDRHAALDVWPSSKTATLGSATITAHPAPGLGLAPWTGESL